MAEKSQEKLNRIFSSGYKISDQIELCRVDRFLVNKFASSLLAGFSRTKIGELIRGGVVRVNSSEIYKPSRRLNLGDLVQIDAKRLDDFSTSLQKLMRVKNFTATGDEKVVIPEDLPINIVYEDDEMMFIDKEAGMVVHPAAGHASGTLANALAWHFQEEGVTKPHRVGLVHRLDKDVSGLMVIAKNNLSLTALAEQFNSSSENDLYCKARKYYLAVVGPVSKAKIVMLGFAENKFVKVEGYIKRSRVDRQRFEFIRGAEESIKQNGARYCLSYVKINREISPNVYLLEIMLVTGRTHQIRATLAGLDLPIRCDLVYGGAECSGVRGVLLRSVRIDLIPPGVYRSLCVQGCRLRLGKQDYRTKGLKSPREGLLGDVLQKDRTVRVKQYVEQGIGRLVVESGSSEWLSGFEVKTKK